MTEWRPPEIVKKPKKYLEGTIKQDGKYFDVVKIGDTVEFMVGNRRCFGDIEHIQNMYCRIIYGGDNRCKYTCKIDFLIRIIRCR